MHLQKGNFTKDDKGENMVAKTVIWGIETCVEVDVCDQPFSKADMSEVNNRLRYIEEHKSLIIGEIVANASGKRKNKNSSSQDFAKALHVTNIWICPARDYFVDILLNNDQSDYITLSINDKYEMTFLEIGDEVIYDDDETA